MTISATTTPHEEVLGQARRRGRDRVGREVDRQPQAGLDAWLASAVVLEPTAASASSRPSASPLSSTPITAAIVGRIAVWIVSQTWST